MFVAVADSPPRIFRTINGNDNGEVVEIDFVVAVAAVMAVTVSNFAHNKQTISNEENVMHEVGEILYILDGDDKVVIDRGNFEMICLGNKLIIDPVIYNLKLWKVKV